VTETRVLVRVGCGTRPAAHGRPWDPAHWPSWPSPPVARRRRACPALTGRASTRRAGPTSGARRRRTG